MTWITLQNTFPKNVWCSVRSSHFFNEEFEAYSELLQEWCAMYKAPYWQ
ncbi:MAG: hypothetical protein P8X96_14270 [Desulfobacteraceae bacterium]